MVKVRAIADILDFPVKENDEFELKVFQADERFNFYATLRDKNNLTVLIPVDLYLAAFERVISFEPEQINSKHDKD